MTRLYSQVVATEVHDEGWAELILNRPERKNAITGPLGEGLAAALSDLNSDDDVRVIVFRGAGGAFCSGLDLNAFSADPAPVWLPEFQNLWRNAHKALFNTRKPVIGALERYAINGGAALALACDLLVVGEGAFIQVGEAQIGMAAPYNLAWMSLRHTESKMAQIALVGDRIYGPEMLSLQLAQTCVRDSEVLDKACELAQRLADYPAGGLGQIKSGLRARIPLAADEWFDQFMVHGSTPKPPPPRSMAD